MEGYSRAHIDWDRIEWVLQEMNGSTKCPALPAGGALDAGRSRYTPRDHRLHAASKQNDSARVPSNTHGTAVVMQSYTVFRYKR